MKIDEIATSWHRVKVFLGPTARSNLPRNLGPLRSMEIHEISWIFLKSIEIVEITANWHQVKVSLGPTAHLNSSRNPRPLKCMKIMKSYENPC